MKKIIIILLLISVVIGATLFLVLSTKSFQGIVVNKNNDTLLIDNCSVLQFGNGEDVAYMCEVEINEKTVI